MTCLVVKAGGSRVFPQWKALFAELMPELEVREWDDPTLDPARIDYALVWQPEPGRLAAMPNLRAILSVAAGVDHVVSDPSWSRSIPLIRMGEEQTRGQMADYVLWAVLSLLRDVPRWQAAQAAAQWVRRECAPLLSSDLRVGVMGLGSLGEVVARRLVAAGFDVLGWSRSQHEIEGVTCFWGEGQQTAFVTECHVLVCLLPETDQTRGLITYELLQQLRQPSGLVNVARGPIVVEADLLRALEEGVLHGAVLDVFDHEPLPADSALWRAPRAIITPHIASEASRPVRARQVVQTLHALERGEDVPLRYDPVRGY
ncbi:glyoxylate/hydroxypyruvate reductase A [Acetobacter suratthaniensis]|uniref:Glyoxylate/hydroxypyruvate reductase A n=1 Tax=Acetobacter suratthaniensis TaxID=1502841 RepID=A0ABS3LH58_9PROT|nr:glyoxylate/hydroxypyruvate reductase A [Acetobacter suratthaniensis]MBO1326928.1 glyoxylate/hydroxypyruvate reductase A [Acetobacter suratthaniensis]MCX2565462.1 glyoxylate/hydroxypyruvate reductase A [Acetobacter suratthaniensis]